MPITLAQAQINARDDIDHAVIDNLRRYTWLWDQIVWDDTVTPGTGGASLTYGYTLLKQARSGQFRRINEEYTPTAASRETKSVSLKPFGGAYNLDRILKNLGPAATNEETFQTQQLMKGATVRLSSEIVNGDTAVDTAGFDGLDKLLTGQSTEYVPNSGTTGYTSWAPGAIDTQEKANLQLDILEEWLSSITPSVVGGGDMSADASLPGGVKAILGNTKSITRLKALARWASLHTTTTETFGGIQRQITRYGEWVLVDLGDNELGSAPIIPIETRDTDGVGGGGNITNVTDLYAASFGLDAFHGAAMAGKPIVQYFAPEWGTPGAVKTGELEIGPGAMVLRNTKSCGVLRNVKVA
ncbi:MAG TPA: hypothetical protein VNO31_35510 [Umezawaea sp.]|nr:hypothetical protein [Umezawaea sp.]